MARLTRLLTSIGDLLALSQLLISAAHATSGELSGKDGNKARFITEPNYVPTYFTISDQTDTPNLLAPGYIFIDPVHGAHKIGIGGVQSGPQIREQDGTLVWYGGGTDSYGADSDSANATRRLRVQDFHVCDYMGTSGKHLCWSEKPAGSQRKKIVVNQNYELVDDITVGFHYDGGTEFANMHEFRMADHGTHYLQPAWPTRHANLADYGGPEDGYMWDGCLQEVDIESRASLFEWCMLENLPIWQTELFPSKGPNITGNITSPKVGDGTSPPGENPWDVWHVNAIDKNADGDYLFSSRHADQILKIAGNNNSHGVEPGTMLWRLGGRGGDIEFDGDWKFSKQHNVRYVETTNETTVFSILDNAWEGALAPSSPYSSGMVISVNNVTKKATMVQRYPHPHGEVAPSQGSVEMLPNGNVFVAWGSRSQFSEFTNDGDLLYHANYSRQSPEEDDDTYTYSYRLTKSAWEGQPTWKPKLITYTQSCDASKQLMAWVSWNGATEVESWNFYISNTPDGPWVAAGSWPKTGYETEAKLTEDSLLGAALKTVAFPRWVTVEAIGKNGTRLNHGTQLVETFVPRKDIRRKHCTSTGCFEDVGFDYDLTYGCADTCGMSLMPQYIVLIIVVAMIEYLVLVYGRIVGAWVNIFSWRRAEMDKNSFLGAPMVAEKTTPFQQYHHLGDYAAPEKDDDFARNTASETHGDARHHERNTSLSNRPGYQRTTTSGEALKA